MTKIKLDTVVEILSPQQIIRELILEQLQSRFNGKMEIEMGLEGRLLDSWVEAIDRSRDQACVRSQLTSVVRTALYQACERQVARLVEQQDANASADHLMLTAGDLLGDVEGTLLDSDFGAPEVLPDDFSELSEFVKEKLPRLARISKSEHAHVVMDRRQLNLVWLADKRRDCLAAAKYYVRDLSSMGLLSISSKVICATAREHCYNDDDRDVCVDENLGTDDVGVLLLVDEAENLCSPGRKRLRTLHQKRQDMITVLVTRTESQPETLDNLVRELFPTTLMLRSKTEDSDEPVENIRKALVEAIQQKFEGKMMIEDGPDGTPIRALARRIAKDCEDSTSSNMIKESVTLHLKDVWNRQTERHLTGTGGGDDDDNDYDYLTLTCEDLIGGPPEMTEVATEE